MKKVKVTAVFKGSDLASKSLGYSHGRQYTLNVKGMTIEDAGGRGGKKCVYGSVQSFLSNWENIHPVK